MTRTILWFELPQPYRAIFETPDKLLFPSCCSFADTATSQTQPLLLSTRHARHVTKFFWFKQTPITRVLILRDEAGQQLYLPIGLVSE
jgi:hypothetical protein